ncbi:hypothetical protein PENSPDRAFT_722327 [Peniophora sp. CONT]|nr:hypothetical protein PENSPDRAFT_722327 [Peniophora sp. CONT]
MAGVKTGQGRARCGFLLARLLLSWPGFVHERGRCGVNEAGGKLEQGARVTAQALKAPAFLSTTTTTAFKHLSRARSKSFRPILLVVSIYLLPLATRRSGRSDCGELNCESLGGRCTTGIRVNGSRVLLVPSSSNLSYTVSNAGPRRQHIKTPSRDASALSLTILSPDNARTWFWPSGCASGRISLYSTPPTLDVISVTSHHQVQIPIYQDLLHACTVLDAYSACLLSNTARIPAEARPNLAHLMPATVRALSSWFSLGCTAYLYGLVLGYHDSLQSEPTTMGAAPHESQREPPLIAASLSVLEDNIKVQHWKHPTMAQYSRLASVSVASLRRAWILDMSARRYFSHLAYLHFKDLRAALSSRILQ